MHIHGNAEEVIHSHAIREAYRLRVRLPGALSFPVAGDCWRP